MAPSIEETQLRTRLEALYQHLEERRLKKVEIQNELRIVNEQIETVQRDVDDAINRLNVMGERRSFSFRSILA